MLKINWSIPKYFIRTSILLHKYLSIYGIDTYNTKNDLSILMFLEGINKSSLKEKEAVCLSKYIECIKNSNPQIKKCL